MSGHKKAYIVAAESSGEQLGAALIRNMRALDPNIYFTGIGGTAMQGEGVISPFDITPLSILGLVEGLRSYPAIMDLVRRACDDIIEVNPDVVVLIDSWGFMIRVAARLKKRGFSGTLIKYVGPQVWAMREGRTKTLAKHVDHLLTIHSFDGAYYDRVGLPVTYIGNPVFDSDYKAGDAAALRADYNVPEDAPVLGVLFGSRLSEIHNLAKPFADAVEILKANIPELFCFAPVSSHIAEDVLAAAAADMRLQEVIMLPENRKLDVFAAATAALACSGTVTTQLACAGVPTTLGYKLSPVTWMIASRLYKPDHVAIVNIAAGAELMPEHLQGEVSGERLAESLRPYLTDKSTREIASKALIAQTDKMRGGDDKASLRAAKAVLALLPQ